MKPVLFQLDSQNNHRVCHVIMKKLLQTVGSSGYWLLGCRAAAWIMANWLTVHRISVQQSFLHDHMTHPVKSILLYWQHPECVFHLLDKNSNHPNLTVVFPFHIIQLQFQDHHHGHDIYSDDGTLTPDQLADESPIHITRPIGTKGMMLFDTKPLLRVGKFTVLIKNRNLPEGTNTPELTRQ